MLTTGRYNLTQLLIEKNLGGTTTFREEIIDNMPSLTPLMDLDEPPSIKELSEALKRLKNRKVGGKSGILPELIHCGNGDLEDKLMSLIEQVWEEGHVVDDWKNVMVVPIPKKGDLRRCDNWRGISLLDVVGKVMARIVKERLEHIAKRVLPEWF